MTHLRHFSLTIYLASLSLLPLLTSNPGKMVDFVKDKDIVRAVPDQFAPYHVRGHPIDWSRPLEGTVFRLPLRTELQGESSTLSKRALSSIEALKLLDNLREEASAMLLFLKNVEMIEISHWSATGDHNITFSCSISNINSAIRSSRVFVGNRNTHEDVLKRNLVHHVDYSLQITCVRNDAHKNENYLEEWEVCNQLGGGSANAIASKKENSLLRLVPWGGVAMCVSTTESYDSFRSVTSGLAYCFLPLPVQTGLPIMVNGFFELSSNRRDVWQAGSDMTGDGQTRAAWNIGEYSIF
jgi:sacsin